MFNATRGNGDEGDIAIDEIKLFNTSCQLFSDPKDLDCSFNVDTCRYQTLAKSKFTWEIDDHTSTPDTGPSRPINGIENSLYYLLNFLINDALEYFFER